MLAALAISTLSMDLSTIDTPALLINKDKVARNIQLAITYAGGVDRLRPHVKTHKLLEVAHLQQEAGLYKFKCATVAEAEMLGMAGAKDVLLAYPVQGPKVSRMIALMQKYPATLFSALVDNYKSAEEINRLATKASITFSVFIDLNVGQSRTGILPEAVPELVEQCENLPQLNIVGLHAYDGHLHMASLPDRTSACRKAYLAVDQLQTALSSRYQKTFTVVAGGSPTFRVHAEHHDVECSPGTFIFWDQGYSEKYSEQAFEVAAQLVTRVISAPDAHTYCLDLGHKSVASEMPFPRIRIHASVKLTQIGHSEEHLVVTTEVPHAFRPGDLLLATPYHICPTVALYDRVHVISQDKLIGEWDVIARNRKITI